MRITNKGVIKAVLVSWIDPVMYMVGMVVLISSLGWSIQTLMGWFH